MSLQLNPDLSGETAVIFGHGNVALDVARMLLSPVDLLKVSNVFHVPCAMPMVVVKICSIPQI